jgi:hypothetical protein
VEAGRFFCGGDQWWQAVTCKRKDGGVRLSLSRGHLAILMSFVRPRVMFLMFKFSQSSQRQNKLCRHSSDLANVPILVVKPNNYNANCSYVFCEVCATSVVQVKSLCRYHDVLKRYEIKLFYLPVHFDNEWKKFNNITKNLPNV